jgi:hypothetical protein
MAKLEDEWVLRLAEELVQIIPVSRLFVKHTLDVKYYAGVNTTACQGGTAKSCQ